MAISEGLNPLAFYLPKDIIFTIFKLLPKNDLATASIVCKYWRTIAKDPIFRWTTLHIVVLHLEGYQTKGDVVDCIEDVDPITSELNTYLVNKRNEKLCLIKKNFNYARRIQPFKSLCNFNPAIYRWILKQIDFFTWRFIVEINAFQFEECLQKNTPFTPSWAMSVIWETIAQENLQVSSARINDQCIGFRGERRHHRSTIPQNQPPGFKEGLLMYKYQLDALQWMRKIEDGFACGMAFNYATVVPWRSARTRYLFDLKNRKILTPQEVTPYLQSFKPRGAVLADEMGLGKTIEMLGLILANPVSEVEWESMKNWNNRIPTEDELYYDRNKTNDLDKLRFRTRATLVACPNHLAQQWKEEITKNTSPVMKVLMLTTIVELRECSYDDIMDADVVIFSYQLLKNGNYIKIGTVRNHLKRTDRPYWVSNQLKRVLRWRRDGEPVKDPPVLEHFEWHRMILDEAHEVITDDPATDTFSMYPAKYYWKCLESLMEFFHFPVVGPAYLWSCTDILMKNLYWRCSKDAAKEEFVVPPVVEEVVMVDFSETERAIYLDNEGHDVNQRRLCSGLLELEQENRELRRRVQYDSLRDLKEGAIDFKRVSIARAETDIEDLDKEIAHLNTLGYAYVPAAIARLSARKADLKKEIENHKNIIALLEAAPNYWDRQLQLEFDFAQRNSQKQSEVSTPPQLSPVQDGSKSHPIDLDNCNNNNNHKRKEIESENEQPPTKKTRLIQELAPTAHEHVSEIVNYVENFGSKFGNMMFYLKRLWERKPEARVIIFSQFDTVLNRVGDMLESVGIPNVFVTGTVITKRKALKSFKDSNSPVRVIMLSLEKAASGTNLIEASHVILVDPVVGTRKEAQAIESQALGRAYRQGQPGQVTLVRFIIKDTIEHRTYQRNCMEDEEQAKQNPPQLQKQSSPVKSADTSVVVENDNAGQSGTVTNALQRIATGATSVLSFLKNQIGSQ